MNQSCQPNSRGARRTDAAGRDLAYVRVMRRLETDIATGRLTPGERLAPERQLGARLDVARNTLRRALTDLAARGLLVSRDRSGWFVKGGPVTIETISGPQGLTDWAAIHGLAVSSTVCQARIRPAFEAEAERLSRSGPTFPVDAAGWNVWQAAQPLAVKTDLPAAGSPAAIVVVVAPPPSFAFASRPKTSTAPIIATKNAAEITRYKLRRSPGKFGYRLGSTNDEISENTMNTAPVPASPI